MSKTEETKKKLQEAKRKQEELRKKREQNNGTNSNNNNTKNNNNTSGAVFLIEANIHNKGTKVLKWEFSSDDTILKIKQCVIQTELSTIKVENITLRASFDGGVKECLNEKTLKECGIDKSKHILILQKLNGGMAQIVNGNQDRERLPNWDCKEIEASFEKDCLIPNNEEELNVQMPCGHVFSSLTLFCIIDANAQEPLSLWQCPIMDCKKDWTFDTLAAAADLNKQEYSKYFNVYIVHKAKLAGDIKDCPFCKVCCERPQNLAQLRVRCTSCNTSDFCFACEQRWIGNGPTVCGNKNCVTYSLNPLLSQCDTIKESNLTTLGGQVAVPLLRACPRCTALIEHTFKCKHHTCYGCQTEFCFVCLQVKEKGAPAWPCGEYSSKCNLAPRQQF